MLAFIDPTIVSWNQVFHKIDIFRERLIDFGPEGRDSLAESEKLSLLLVVILTYPVHRLCEIQVEQTHGKRDDIPAEVIGGLLLVV